MSSRAAVLKRISNTIGNRRVVWAGLRSDDADSLAELPQLSGSYSIIGGVRRRSSVEEVRFEDLSGIRMDVDAWDIERDLDTQAGHEFREALLRSLAGSSALVPYRSSAFLSAVCFARQDRCINLGMFGGLQAAFEHKPWVESSIASLGIPHIPWTYIADEEKPRAKHLLSDGPVMIRRSRTSGGEGLYYVDNPDSLGEVWPQTPDAFVSIAPHIDHALPVNIGGTVWHDGVTIQHPSVQLIGLPSCTTRRFGYFGNDFSRIKDVDHSIVDQIETSTMTIGQWLREHGYRGTFGVDFLVTKGSPLFTEVNARFQGSTHASARLSVEQDESCLLLDHLAAMLGFDAPRGPSLRDLVKSMSPLSHVVVHWTGEHPTRLNPTTLIREARRNPAYSHSDVVTRPDLVTERGGVVARLTTRESVTTSGFDLSPAWTKLVSESMRDSWIEQSMDRGGIRG